MTIKTESVSLEDARRVVAAGKAKANEIGSPSNIAVVDVGGNLVAHIRMDEAWIGSVDISISKAFTSRAFDISTADLAANAGPGDQFFGINASNNGRVMIFAGGVPLRQGDRIVGAVGVSGGSGEQDRGRGCGDGLLRTGPAMP
ncbi:heme-binding protein [Streptomyces sp. NPDC005548]|uniref:GlcG/HbpS family heme-binding protein n=1 Tax=Streptomyces sp. NPDC005548 TaxID=3364724 RepID=UPI00367F9581